MQRFKGYLPGILLALALAMLSLYLAKLPLLRQWGISAAILAIVTGMVFGNTVYHRMAPVCHRGVDFSKQKILRLAIILFGLKLTFQDIAIVGIRGIFIDALMICSTFALTLWLEKKWLHVDKHSAILIGSGASICGAAAVMATGSVIHARTEKVTMAVATVVVFGTAAMFLYPLLYGFAAQKLGISEAFFGIYTGSTVHEVAQVAAAGNAIGPIAENNAVISKMIRVLMLAPFLLFLSWQLRRRHRKPAQQSQKLVIPWFAMGFMLMAALNSVQILPAGITQWAIRLDEVLLTSAMAALGLTSHVGAFQKAGAKPLLLAAAIFCWLLAGGGAINFALLSCCR